MCRQPLPRKTRHCRRGVISLLVAMVLLVVMAAVALTLDSLWLRAARMELTTCAEAAALASARQLAGDDRLRRKDDRDALAQARRIAQQIARENPVAGAPVELSERDIRFGRLVPSSETGRIHFLNTRDNPTTVRVVAHRTRRRNNPVALFLGDLAGRPFADVVAQAEATLSNHVAGVRPLAGTCVPAFPLAILKHDPMGLRGSWDEQIEAHRGADRYGIDSSSGRITVGPDGLPEMDLFSQGLDEESALRNNVQLLAFGDDPAEQILRGWELDDLLPIGGELRFDEGSVRLPATPRIGHDERSAFDQMLGQCRMALLYDLAASDDAGQMQVSCCRLVAIRILAVHDQSDGSCRITVQPGVMTTATALLSGAAGENPYVYKLQLTH